MFRGLCGHWPCPEDCCPAHLPHPPQDCFFYSLVFDPVQKTLLADQGEIRVGCKFQAEIPDRLAEGKQQDRLAAGLADIRVSALCALRLCSAGLHARCRHPDRMQPPELEGTVGTVGR